jgi:hypothetical protein
MHRGCELATERWEVEHSVTGVARRPLMAADKGKAVQREKAEIMDHTRYSSLGLLSVMCVFGCNSAKPVDVGDTEVLGEQLSDYAGSWEGYIEAATWSDGSDAVRIKLDAQGGGVFEIG